MPRKISFRFSSNVNSVRDLASHRFRRRHAEAITCDTISRRSRRRYPAVRPVWPHSGANGDAEKDEMARQNLEVIILAAGLGTRMKSATSRFFIVRQDVRSSSNVLDPRAQLSDAAPHGRRPSTRAGARECRQSSAVCRAGNEQMGTGHAVLRRRRISKRPDVKAKDPHPFRRCAAHAAETCSACSTSTSALETRSHC